MNKTLLTVLLLCGAVGVAQAGIPNPLVRPAQKKAAEEKEKADKEAVAHPTPPPPPQLSLPQPRERADDQRENQEERESLRNLRRKVTGLRVVAVQGTRAILRVMPITMQAPTTGSAAAPAAAATAGAATGADDALPLYSLMRVQDGGTASINGKTLRVAVRGDEVSLTYETTGDVVYAGALGPSYAVRAPIELEKPDTNFTTSVTPGAASASTPGPGVPAAPRQ